VGESKRNFQFHLPSWRKKFLVKQALTLRYAAKPKDHGREYDTAKTTTTKKQHKILSVSLGGKLEKSNFQTFLHEKTSRIDRRSLPLLLGWKTGCYKKPIIPIFAADFSGFKGKKIQTSLINGQINFRNI
jgi:hypothetical protein